MTNYPNDPNQPDGNGEPQPNDGSGYPQYGNPPQGGPQYGAPQGGSQYGAQPYGSPQYGAPQPGSPYGPPQPGSPYGEPKPGSPYGAPAPAGDHGKATLIMVLGILSIVCCGLFTGVPAIIMGRQAMAEIDSSGGAVGGRGKVKAGFICGIIGTAWSILGIIIRLTAR